MKKILLISTIMLISVNIASAESGIDFKLGPSPYQSLQKARFDKESTERMQNAQRSAEEYAESRYKSLDREKIESLKPKPQINLESNTFTQNLEQEAIINTEQE